MPLALNRRVVASSSSSSSVAADAVVFHVVSDTADSAAIGTVTVQRCLTVAAAAGGLRVVRVRPSVVAARHCTLLEQVARALDAPVPECDVVALLYLAAALGLDVLACEILSDFRARVGGMLRSAPAAATVWGMLVSVRHPAPAVATDGVLPAVLECMAARAVEGSGASSSGDDHTCVQLLQIRRTLQDADAACFTALVPRIDSLVEAAAAAAASGESLFEEGKPPEAAPSPFGRRLEMQQRGLLFLTLVGFVWGCTEAHHTRAGAVQALLSHAHRVLPTDAAWRAFGGHLLKLAAHAHELLLRRHGGEVGVCGWASQASMVSGCAEGSGGRGRGAGVCGSGGELWHSQAMLHRLERCVEHGGSQLVFSQSQAVSYPSQSQAGFSGPSSVDLF